MCALLQFQRGNYTHADTIIKTFLRSVRTNTPASCAMLSFIHCAMRLLCSSAGAATAVNSDADLNQKHRTGFQIQQSCYKLISRMVQLLCSGCDMQIHITLGAFCPRLPFFLWALRLAPHISSLWRWRSLRLGQECPWTHRYQNTAVPDGL